ncbi:MAG: response regulator [Oscillospiraceae bacterium]|jgi:signal transduction histidine kinase|nr:response regulator [Oscillospiraceae bacterium]
MDNARGTIMLVDDNIANLTIGREILKPSYQVIPVPSAAKMFEALDKVAPDLILLDVNMPDMDGFEAMKRLKADARFHSIPVIFLTIQSDENSELEGLSLGAADYIFKPYSAPLLLKRIENFLAQKRSDEANKIKTSFLAGMSHEIRTPMNSIVGMAELLRNEPLSARQMEYVMDISESARTMTSIINDLLDMAKIEANKLKLEPVNYQFQDFWSGIVSMFTRMAEAKSISFRHEIKGEPGRLFGDEVRLKQILMNLCENAIRFTDSGYVRLSAAAGQDALIFEIEDTGKGIRKEDLPKLFDIYAQSDTIKNRAAVGTGLGLSICKSLVNLMGGGITVDSVHGQGTLFTVTVPLVKGKAEEETKPERRLCAPSAHALVVDDNKFNLRVAEGLLRLFKINVQTALSGQEGIDLASQNDFDIIFMDHMMPHMDGVEATKRIRRLGGEYSRLPIVALTATVVEGAEEMFLSNGFNAYLPKPIDPQTLISILKKWLPPDKVMDA